MENRINVAELLKDCPSGMELDCTMFENVTFVRVDMGRKQFPIEIAIGGIRSKYLTKEGCFHDTTLLPESKCVIFPKGKTTWEGFVPPSKFKDGDIIFTYTGKYGWISIFKQCIGNSYCTYIDLYINDNVLFTDTHRLYDIENIIIQRHATEDEKEKLFNVIKENGYHWDNETKTLVKLVEPRFDINTLVPFESEVLVRNDEHQYWIPAFWGFKRKNDYTTTFGWCRYCIPYKGNEHLLGTTDDCEERFKTWK